jgi:hypothetical protein
VVSSILTSFIVVFGAMVLIGGCVIPYIWGVVLRLTLTKQTPVSYQLLVSKAKTECQIMLNEFKKKNGKIKSWGNCKGSSLFY